jgi:hypothetical protein
MASDNLILEIMKYGIVAVGLLVAYAELRQARMLIHTNYGWTKYGLGIMGLYWSAYYLRSILDIGIASHQIFVRGPLLLTLALIASGAIMSLRRRQ